MNCVSAPIGKIRDQDILAEPVDIPADAVIVFAEPQGNVSVFSFKAQVVQILGQVQIFADLRVTLTHLAFLGPSASVIPDLGSYLVQRGLELLQFGLESVSLLGRRERVVRYHDGALRVPILPARAPGQKQIILAAFSLEFLVMPGFHHFEVITVDMDEFFGEIGRIRGDEVNTIPVVDDGEIVRRIHALVEDDGDFFLSTPQHGLADVIKDGPEQLGVVPIAFVFAVKKRQPGMPVHQ
jgi:hypothetical protein